ncbi:hypothetical protein GCM10011409_06000 [Lentibacillus populi]|uniref:Uncharacterized protein n=1 Tax=Lentibacillus populi TaxID=1827502 RepID=A0A9W5X400_9BACI|nr:hypothetical protein GCM10011409_06000 [Lentibacillus populi]
MDAGDKEILDHIRMTGHISGSTNHALYKLRQQRLPVLPDHCSPVRTNCNLETSKTADEIPYFSFPLA